jgi:hypothetical protein
VQARNRGGQVDLGWIAWDLRWIARDLGRIASDLAGRGKADLARVACGPLTQRPRQVVVTVDQREPAQQVARLMLELAH